MGVVNHWQFQMVQCPVDTTSSGSSWRRKMANTCWFVSGCQAGPRTKRNGQIESSERRNTQKGRTRATKGRQRWWHDSGTTARGTRNECDVSQKGEKGGFGEQSQRGKIHWNWCHPGLSWRFRTYPKSSRKTSKLKWPIAYYHDKKKERLFYLLLHILFLLKTIGTFIECLACTYVIFVLSMIRFVIARLGMAAFFIILQQLMLLLLAISLFAKVQLLLPEFLFESTMRPLSVFRSQKVGPWNKLLICQK